MLSRKSLFSADPVKTTLLFMIWNTAIKCDPLVVSQKRVQKKTIEI